MDKEELFLTIIAMLLVIGIFVFGFFVTDTEEFKANQLRLQEEQEKIRLKQEQCNHNFVLINDYNLFLRAYKIKHKCTNCGYVVE